MPTAKKLPSGSWRCRVFSHYETIFDENGNQKQKAVYESFTCTDPTSKGKRIAEQMAADFAADKDTKKRVRKQITVITAVSKYIETKQAVLSPSTVRVYKMYLRNDFHTISNIPLDELDQQTIQLWIATISKSKNGKERNPKTVRNVYGLLSASLDMFAPDMHFRITLPEKKKSELYVPSDADVKKLLEHTKGTDLEIAIMLAAFGPMRRGEICALTSDDVKGEYVTVNKDMVLNENNEWVIKPPKTYSSNRTILYPAFVAEKLSGITGKIIDANPTQLTNRFRRAIKFAHMDTSFRFHDLRHYSASIMHAIGIPDVYIMQRGGWATDNVMKTVYRNVINDEAKKMTKKINNHFDNL